MNPSKYRARRCTTCTPSHASLRECRRAQELRLLERAGEILSLQEQVRVPLCGHADKPLVWVADFVYWERCDGRDEWQQIYEDCKGYDKNPVWRLKRHLLADQGIEVRIT